MMSTLSDSKLILAAFALATSWGCAHGEEQVKNDELQRTVSSLRTQNASYLRHIEELENQVFILSDQAESQQVNAQRVAAPDLPRVTLQPGRTEPALAKAAPRHFGSTLIGAPASDSFASGDEGDDGPDSEVEYVGEAARPSSDRPVLRLVGDSGGITVDEQPRAEAGPRARPTVARVAVVGDREARAKLGTASQSRGGAAALSAYRAALDQLNGGQHADAAAAFREFLGRFHEHDYADNAQYWLGECYYDLKDYTSAVREFRRVVEVYPQGNKVPDAMLKAGFAYQAMGQVDASRQMLEELRRTYPEHPAARLASDRLAALESGSGAAQEP